MNTNVILGLCFVRLIITFFIVRGGINIHCKHVVVEKSAKLHEQTVLNERYREALIFPENKSSHAPVHQAKSLASYRNFNLKSFACSYMEKHPNRMQKFISENEKNIALYEEYKKCCAGIEILETVYPSFQRKCRKIEGRLFAQIPVYDSPEVLFKVRKSYVSPKGRNHYSDSREFNTKECQILLEEAKERKRKVDYRLIERRKMTSKLRYEVLKRDHYHCVICGRGQEDGVKLHVDHIVPVSKGGKTELSNLRTLCEDCNLGKSDEYDEAYDYAQ